MPRIQSTTPQDKAPVGLEYVDYGTGDPVVFIHGWPLSHRMWEAQVSAVVPAGHRAIAYDRRGFGASDAPWGPFDYDTLAADLNNLLTELDVRNATLVGFSMGGGEVARYLSTYGNDRVSRAVLVSSVVPYMLQTDDNQSGVPKATLNGIVEGVSTDRIRFLDDFNKMFFGVKKPGKVVDDATLQYYATIAGLASPIATVKCAEAFGTTDFRDDAAKIDVPTLIVHGTDDQVVPITTGGDEAAKLIRDNQYLKIDGAPHALTYTHREELNTALLNFLG